MSLQSVSPTRRRALWASSALVLAVSASAAAHAQTVAPAKTSTQQPSQVGEVIVTAQRVKTTLQKTAASVSVLSADNLRTAGAKDFSDVAELVPNFTFTSGFRSGVVNISIRGIPTVQGGDPPAAFVVDGVQTPALDFVNQDLLDIANIQVLRGPQGGIYGRDAIGGAVIIETQKPTDTFHYTLTVDGGNGGYFQAVNTASGAIIADKLWAKLTVEDHQFGGLLQDVTLNKPADFVQDYAGRLEILAKPTDTTTIDLTTSHTQGRDGMGEFSVISDYGIGHFEQNPLVYPYPSYDKRFINTYTAKIDQVTPIGTLTSVSQYALTNSTVHEQTNFTTTPEFLATEPNIVKAFNEDLHLSSPSDQPIQWIVGGFYQLRQNITNLNFFFQPGPGGGNNPVCGCVGGPGNPLLLDDDHNSSLAEAIYAQASIPLPANLKLNVAARYDIDKRYDNDLSIPVSPTNAISHTFGAFEPDATLSEQFTPDLMGYISVGKGFRSGGFNAYSDVSGSNGVVPRLFPQETVVNYETGFKSQFLDRHLTINADFFHSDYSNEQYFFYSADPPARDIVSIKSVTYNGGEVEVNYMPVNGLTLSASGGVADSTINSNDPGQNDKGKHSPQANLYTADLSAVYRQPLWNDYNALYRIDYNYKGTICYDSANQYCYHPGGFVNARVGVENDRYSIALWGKNIFSNREPVDFAPNAGGPGVSFEMPNEPATYGVEVSARF
jgi:iron complex outermembrane receptor protein